MYSRAPQTSQEIPLQVVGSLRYGRYNKISVENSYNFFQVDKNDSQFNFMVPFAGYQWRLNFNKGQSGRGIYSSLKANKMFVVVDNILYSVNTGLAPVNVGTLKTSLGDIFIAEDTLGNIAICDKTAIYIYNYNSNTFQQAYTTIVGGGLNFTPTHVNFQDGRFIATDSVNGQWRLSDPTTNNLQFPTGAQFVGAFNTKADTPVATVRFPGRGNLLLVLGSQITEAWFDAGLALFPYQKQINYNLDYGLLNATTIAYLENYVVWVGINDRSGPVILFSNGSDVQSISTDGINYKLANLNNPQQCYGFAVKQDGHLFYVVTFYNPADNLTLAYDFTTSTFYTLTDENMNYHIAKRIVFFDNTYYFISINDANLYELNSQYTNFTYEYPQANEPNIVIVKEIPRVRICPTFRKPDGVPFITNSVAFVLEQGDDPNNRSNSAPAYNPGVDLAISNDGGDTWSNYWRQSVNPIGNRQNRFVYYGLGYSNEITCQFRFVGLGRFVASNGVMNIYG